MQRKGHGAGRTALGGGVLLLLALLGGCDFIGGGETVVRGSNNLVVDGDSPDAVARLMARLIDTPEITDAELRDLLAIIRARAAEGDVRAIQVLLRLAAIQREPEEPEA